MTICIKLRCYIVLRVFRRGLLETTTNLFRVDNEEGNERRYISRSERGKRADGRDPRRNMITLR